MERELDVEVVVAAKNKRTVVCAVTARTNQSMGALVGRNNAV